MRKWPEVALGDVCEFKYGKGLPAERRETGAYPVYGSNGVVGSHVEALTSGATIVVGRKGSFGEVHFTDGPCWPIDTTYYVDASCTDVDLKWLARSLRTLGLTSLNRAAAIPGLNREDAYRKRLLLPPLGEQRRIAAILDQADVLRAKRGAVVMCIEELARAMFADMFASVEWPLVSAGELMPDMRNGLSPSNAGSYLADVLTLSAVTRGAFDATASKRGCFAVDPPADKRVSGRDFLMCRGNGNKHLVGVGVFSGVDMPQLVFPDTVIAGRVDCSKVTMRYLATAWHQPNARRQIEAVARTTNGTYKVNQQTLSGVLVPLPPLPLQREFDQQMVRLDAQRARIDRAFRAELDLFDAIQGRALAGGL